MADHGNCSPTSRRRWRSRDDAAGEDGINEKVLFDTSEEAIAAAVRKHDEELARL